MIAAIHASKSTDQNVAARADAAKQAKRRKG
jgi:hypothetical protein